MPLVTGADWGGQQTAFFIDHSYDLQKRAQLTASLIRISPSLYFYLDDSWWKGLSQEEQQAVKFALQHLEEEFEENIYPNLTETFGKEWRPGIDKDPHITVLFHPMIDRVGGYVNTGDEYSRLQNPFSNQRELIYLNSRYLTTPLAKSFLAHEFLHLITFNQKERKFGVSEEVWLNEARAEYAPTLLGYDRDFENSNLKRRVEIFLQYPNDSLTEWANKEADYGVLNLFVQYLVERYGSKVLVDSLKSEKVGIPALNEALLKNGFSEDFSQIFTDWTIAVSLNDCQISERYCFQNPHLKKIKIIPSINFLPLKGKSTLALTGETKNWSGNWYKFVGGKGNLKLEFAGFPDARFRVPLLLLARNGEKKVDFLELNNSQQGRTVVENFGTEIASVTIIPSLQSKISNFSSKEKAYPFFWSVSTAPAEVPASAEEAGVSADGDETTQTEDIQVLLRKIEFLEKQLAVLQAQLKELMGVEEIEQTEQTEQGQFLSKNLRYGDRGEQVKLLQSWLAKDAQVYPEGLVTGYFGPLTKAAVIRFQEKYQEDVLAPWGLKQGTGFVGPTTKAKLNQLYGEL